jgi:hypothetical protein
VKGATAFLILSLAAGAQAQERNPANYVRFLLPVIGSSAGANGARWEATLWLRNDGDHPVDIFPLTPDCFCCSNCLRLRAYPALLPNQDGFRTHAGLPEPFGPWLAGGPGVFLYVERLGASRLSANLEVGDSSRETTRTTLPIVPETDFVAGRRSIIAIPLTLTSRITVRAYQLEPRAASQIAVRVYEFGPAAVGAYQFRSGKLLAEAALTFERDPHDECPQPIVCPAVPYHPGYMQISDVAATMPQILTNASVTHQLRIEFEPADPAELYWPIVTVTDNLTNAVQIFTSR